MRLIVRWIWVLLVNVSLLAMVVVVWLWVRSYGGVDGARREYPQSAEQRLVRWQLISHDGALWLAKTTESLWHLSGNAINFRRGDRLIDVLEKPLPPAIVPQGKFGLQRVQTRVGSRVAASAWLCALPHWLAVVVLAHLPAAAMWSAIRRRQRKMCYRCGGSVKAGVCGKCAASERTLLGSLRAWVGAVVVMVCVPAIGIVIWAWIYSRFACGEIALGSTDQRHELPNYQTAAVMTTRGSMSFGSSRVTGPRNLPVSSETSTELRWGNQPAFGSTPMNPRFNIAGVAFARHATQPGAAWGQRVWVLTLPYWLLLVLFTSPLVLMAWRASRRRRPRLRRLHGHCEKCGYDLRASSGRCPECGFEKNHGLAARVT
jgi:hypothetical protein